MLQALLATFREGLESFLIVAVIVGYLRRTGRAPLVRGVHAGLVASLFTCTIGAYYWYQWLQSEEGGPNQAKIEAFGALLAAILVGALLFQTVRMGRRLRSEIEARVERAAGGETPSWRGLVGVALVTTLLITREGFEAVFFVGVQAFLAKAAPMVIGAGIGLLLAGALAWLWTRSSLRLEMGVLLRVTAIYLALFLVQLLVYGVHELSESGLIHGSQAFHDATERFGPEGDIGHLIAYSVVAAPAVYLLLARRRRPAVAPPTGEPARRAAG